MSNVNLKDEKLKQRLTLLAMVLSYIPFLVFAQFPSNSASSVATYFASQLGYLAAVFLLWQFLLGTRSVSALIHKDQVWVLQTHKKLGIYGVIFVLAHPLLIMYNYNEGIQYLFFGELTNDFQRHVAMGRVAFILFMVVWISSAILRSRIGYRPWKYIHYLTYLLMPLVLLHAPGVGSFYAGDAALQALWKVMTLIYIVFVALRLRQLFTYGQYPYKLMAKKEVGPGVFLYKLRPQKKELTPAAGQYMYVRRSFWSEEHPFSVANYSPQTKEISIASKVFGSYTKKLSKLTVGSVIYLDGPYGVFTKQVEINTKDPVTFVAGGIGVTPFIRHILASGRDDITLFNANRSEQQIFLRETLAQKLGDNYIDVLSDDPGVKNAKQGYVTADLIKEHHGALFGSQQYFICGPPPMMEAVKASLLDAGIPASSIFTEEFGF